MNGIWGIVIGLGGFNILTLGVVFIGIGFVKPRWPDWWEKHIVAPDPEETKQPAPAYSLCPSPGLLFLID